MVESSTKIMAGAIGILSIVSIIMGAGLLGKENVYYCSSSQVALTCSSLSKISNGIQTRCYYEENSTKYRICSEGWIKFENQKIQISKDTDLICSEGELIKECSGDGKIILRVKNEGPN